MNDTMSQSVYRSVFQVFGIEPNEKERSVIDSFVNSPQQTSLFVSRTADYQRLVFQTDRNDHEGDLLVFFKVVDRKNGLEEIVDESATIAGLRSLISECGSDQASLMNTLSELHKYAKTEHILTAIQAERRSLLDKIGKWVEDTGGTDRKGPLIQEMGYLKSKENKLKAVAKVYDLLFNDLLEYPSVKSSLKHEAKETAEEYNTLFRNWIGQWSRIKLDTNRACIEIHPETQVPFVSFDPRLVTMGSECRTLRAMGFILPSQVIEAENRIRKYAMIARELREIVNFYCTIGDQILLS